MKAIEVFGITTKKIPIPLVNSTVNAGFPSPAAGYEEETLDINDIVVSNPNSTFYVRVKGNSMIGDNIHDGDILVVDKSLDPVHGKIVIAIIDDEFTVKRLYNKDGLIKLLPANPEFPEILFKNEQELKIWGVVSYTIHKN